MLQLLLYLDGNYWYPHLLSLLELILNEDEPLFKTNININVIYVTIQ
jgi:hypothetical protein